MAEQKKRPSFVSPAGTAVYPWLTKADDRPINGKPQKPAFKVKLRLDGEAAQTLKAKIDPLVEESFKEAVKAAKPEKKKKIERAFPYVEKTDESGEHLTGEIEFSFKQNAEIKKQNGETVKVKIPLFDAKGKPLPAGVSPWNGSVIKVSFSTRPYMMESTNKAGVTLDLNAVQVLKLVAAGQRGADEYGFGAEEGYSYDGEDEAPPNTEAGDPGPTGAPDSGEADF